MQRKMLTDAENLVNVHYLSGVAGLKGGIWYSEEPVADFKRISCEWMDSWINIFSMVLIHKLSATREPVKFHNLNLDITHPNLKCSSLPTFNPHL